MTLVGDVYSGGAYARAELERIWEIFVPSSHFCCESKTALKK